VPQEFKTWVSENAERISTARSLPYFIKDNYQGRLKEYASYKINEKYTDVAFNYANGGLKAMHVNHVEKAEIHAKERKYFATDNFEGYTDLEVLCQQVLYKNGYSCILVDEKVKDTDGNMMTALDTLTNGMHTDIRSITEQGKNTIKNCINEKLRQLRKFNKINGEDNNQLILYFHKNDLYSYDKVSETLHQLQQYGSSLRRIICVLNQSGKVIEIE